MSYLVVWIFVLVALVALMLRVVLRPLRKPEALFPDADDRTRLPLYTLPSSLADADNALKLEYDELIQIFESSCRAEDRQEMIERGRRLAEAMSTTARSFGYSKALEMSNDIPALTYWAAELAKRCYPADHERRLDHEASLRYYTNFDTTKWLWERYREGEDEA